MKTIFVTGGAKRIGKAIIELFASDGWKVIIHFNNSKADAEALADSINAKNSDTAFIVQGDLDKTNDIKNIISQVDEFTDSLDVLVNNASTFYPTPLNEVSEEHWEKLIGSNLKGPLFLIQGLKNKLKDSGGSIINITDTNMSKGVANYSIYSAAKGGLETITKSLARELAPEITVNAIAPGVMLEPPGVEWTEDQKEKIISKIPLNRMGSEKDLAEAVKFVVNSKYITGQTIKVDGGRSLL